MSIVTDYDESIDHEEPYCGPTIESADDCNVVSWGHDVNGDEWCVCLVHGYMVLGDCYVCEGYVAPSYVERSAPLLHKDGNGRTVAYLSTLDKCERTDKGHLMWLRANGERN